MRIVTGNRNDTTNLHKEGMNLQVMELVHPP